MGVSGQRHAPAELLPPGKGPPVPIVQEAGWAPETVWTQRIEEKSFSPARDRTPKRFFPPGGPFPGTKARPGRDADHSPPSSAEVENE
jgi:hypothetical protein